MMTRFCRNKDLRSGLPRLIYLAGTLLVFSFIFFEVLDIDGSEFRSRPIASEMPATLSAAGHDIRKVLLQNPVRLWFETRLVLEDHAWETVRDHDGMARTALAASLPPTHRYPAILPRAALLEPPSLLLSSR